MGWLLPPCRYLSKSLCANPGCTTVDGSSSASLFHVNSWEMFQEAESRMEKGEMSKGKRDLGFSVGAE